MCKTLQVSPDRTSILDGRSRQKYSQPSSLIEGQGCSSCNEQVRCHILAIFNKR